MKPIVTINGAWSEQANAWVSETLCLTGDCWLEASLPSKGRVVIKKSENDVGPWPKAFISKWAGPDFRLRLYGSTEKRYIKIYFTVTPNSIQYANI